MSENQTPISAKTVTMQQRVRAVVIFLIVFVPLSFVYTKGKDFVLQKIHGASKVEEQQIPGAWWGCKVTNDHNTEVKDYKLKFDSGSNRVYFYPDSHERPNYYYVGSYGVLDHQAHRMKLAFQTRVWDGKAYSVAIDDGDPPGTGRYEWDMTITHAFDGEMKFNATEFVRLSQPVNIKSVGKCKQLDAAT
jgi:hypothetical protein